MREIPANLIALGKELIMEGSSNLLAYRILKGRVEKDGGEALFTQAVMGFGHGQSQQR